MVSLTILLPFPVALLLLFNNEVNAAAIAQGNYLPETKRNTEDASSCCIIPTCDEYGQCLGTLSCGYICSYGRYPPANYGVTRGYKLKDYYSKYDCKFGECKEYKFLCNHCPNPNESNFSFYTVRDDCRSCYEQFL